MSWEPVWVKDATGGELTPIRACVARPGLAPGTLSSVLLHRVVSALATLASRCRSVAGRPPRLQRRAAPAAPACPPSDRGRGPRRERRSGGGPVAAPPFHMPCAADDVTGCTRACDDGFVEDCVTLGVMYLDGSAVGVDRDRAVGLFHTACGKDPFSARGCLLLADAYHAGIVPGKAHAEENALYRRACEGGANLGCVVAGQLLVSGHGVDRDPAPGRTTLLHPGLRICGNAEACLELGKLVQRGEGAKKNPERALSLFRKACGLGLAEACLHADPKGTSTRRGDG